MRTKVALIKNAVSSGWGKSSNIINQLVQVPILISVLGVEDYGRWLVISSFAVWIKLANMGFGNVAGNQISMQVASQKFEEAKITYSTVFYLIAIISVAGAIISLIIIPIIPWQMILKVNADRNFEVMFAILLQAFSVLLSFNNELFFARFRAAQKVHIALFLISFWPWLNLISLIISFQFGVRFDYMAISSLIAYIIFFVTNMLWSRRYLPTVYFLKKLVDRKQYKLLFKKGSAFQAITLGQALLSQGNLLVVQTILGPAAVALFSTARKMIQVVNQIVEMLNQISWPGV